jgi:hypothetical protein
LIFVRASRVIKAAKLKIQFHWRVSCVGFSALATLDVRPLDRLHPHALVAHKQALTDLGFSSLHRKVVKKAMASMSAHAGESALEARGALWG